MDFMNGLLLSKFFFKIFSIVKIMQKGKPCKIKQLQQHINYMYYIRLKEKDKLFHRLSIYPLKFGTLTLYTRTLYI